MNKLYFGDCLTIIRDRMSRESVDLVYLDPPHRAQASYGLLYQEETGRPLPDQIKGFNDAWPLYEEREGIIGHMPLLLREAGVPYGVSESWRLWMTLFRDTRPDLVPYLANLVERLIWIKGIIKPTGSIYLHCDPAASHYIKVMMDGIFGQENFKNDIAWHYKNKRPAMAEKRRNWPSFHEKILFYSKTSNHTFNYEEGIDQTNKKRLEPCSDVWEIDPLPSRSTERVPYATQKPLALVNRIIEASSNEGDLVFDPFCGCGTTLEAAHRLNRRWIGIDIGLHAIRRVSAVRLRERSGLEEGKDFVIDGVPENLEEAKQLWKNDKFSFQTWAVEMVDGFVTDKKTEDGGMDGRLYFQLEDGGGLQSMKIEVKGGKNVGIDAVRKLRGMLDNGDALMAGLVIMDPPGKLKERSFQREMDRAGHLRIGNNSYCKLQLLTAEDVLRGLKFVTPHPLVGRESRRARLI